jgi:hypothetical protein
MLEAEQSYLFEKPSAMTRGSLVAALLALFLPKPKSIVGPMSITCIGMKPLAPFPPTCAGMPWPTED